MLVLSGSNTIAGATVVSAGTLRVGSNSTNLNLVQNGSFETPLLGSNSFSYFTTQIPSLIMGRRCGTRQAAGPALVNTSGAWGYSTPYPAGSQAVSMQNDATLTETVNFPRARSLYA